MHCFLAAGNLSIVCQTIYFHLFKEFRESGIWTTFNVLHNIYAAFFGWKSICRNAFAMIKTMKIESVFPSSLSLNKFLHRFFFWQQIDSKFNVLPHHAHNPNSCIDLHHLNWVVKKRTKLEWNITDDDGKMRGLNWVYSLPSFFIQSEFFVFTKFSTCCHITSLCDNFSFSLQRKRAIEWNYLSSYAITLFKVQTCRLHLHFSFLLEIRITFIE